MPSPTVDSTAPFEDLTSSRRTRRPAWPRPAAAAVGGPGPSHPEDHLWEISDVALYLGVPRSTVYKMTAPKSANPIPHLKLGRLLRFRRVDIDAWLDLWAVSPIDALSRAGRLAKRA